MIIHYIKGNYANWLIWLYLAEMKENKMKIGVS